jgi:putative copper resistance protein D
VIGGLVAAMTVLLVWLHVLAAVAWIGGTIFLSVVLAPLVRSHKAAPEFMALFRLAARRFRVVVWSAIALLLTTGPVLLYHRGLSIFAPIGWPQVLRIKLGLVAVLLLLTVAHDLLLGPAVRRIGAISVGARTRWEQTLVRLASWVPRVGVLLALGVLFAAVMLARS